MNVAEYARMRDLEDWYWWFVARRRAAARFVRDTAPDRKPLRILDAGCGTGAMLDLFRRWPGVEVTGMDISPEALRFTRSRGHEGLVEGDLASLPFASESFDVVTSLDVIEHVQDDRRAVAEISRVLRPGGVMVATVPAFQFLWSRHDDANQHHRRYTAQEFRALLKGSGLRLEWQTYLLFALFPVAAAVRLARAHQHFDDPNECPALDVPRVPRLVNWALVRFLELELALARRVSLPVGLTVLTVARKEPVAAGAAQT